MPHDSRVFPAVPDDHRHLLVGHHCDFVADADNLANRPHTLLELRIALWLLVARDRSAKPSGLGVDVQFDRMFHSYPRCTTV
jgi:hypothetical protein